MFGVRAVDAYLEATRKKEAEIQEVCEAVLAELQTAASADGFSETLNQVRLRACVCSFH